MNLTKTLTDRELELKIRGAEKYLAQMNPGSYVHGLQTEQIAYYKSQLTKPKEDRCKYERGTL